MSMSYIQIHLKYKENIFIIRKHICKFNAIQFKMRWNLLSVYFFFGELCFHFINN